MDEYIIVEKRKQAGLIILVSAIGFIMTFDYGCLNISLSAIAGFFNVKLAAVSWLPTLCFLIITGALLSFAKLGDIIGYKKVFLWGLVVYAVGALFYALSPSFSLLLTSRTIQSFGEAMFLPIGIAMLSAFLPNEIKGKAFGFYAMAQGLGIAVGQAGGGWLIAKFSWRSTSYAIVFIVLIIFLAALKIIPLKQKKISDRRLDLVGAFLFFIAMASFLYYLNLQSTISGPKQQGVFIYVVVFLIAGILFFWREKSVAYPLLDLNLFKNRDFSFAAAAAFFIVLLNIGSSFVFPLYLELLKHYSVFQRGLIMLAPSLTMMVLSPISGHLSDRAGSRKICIWGMIVTIAAFILLSLLHESTSLLFIIFALVFLGIGIGLFLAPNNRLVLSFAPEDKHGVASGVYKICMNAGSSIGIALFMLVGARAMSADIVKLNIGVSEIKSHPDVMVVGFHGVFIVAIIISVLTLVLSILAHDKK